MRNRSRGKQRKATPRQGYRRAVVSPTKKPSIFVRPIEVSDFDFIRTLASKIEGYTIPPPYVLWMFSRFQMDFCAVAQENDGCQLGYLLAMSGLPHPATAFVWQFACTFRGQRLQASRKLAKHLKTAVEKHGIGKILFTTVPRSAADRSVAAVAKKVFHALPRPGPKMPKSVSSDECEYCVHLATLRT